MDALASILEEEFALAFEVKDEKALRRSLTLLTGGMVAKSEYEKEQNSLSSDIKLLVIEMKEGFRRMDERFEAVDKRFEAVDKHFDNSQSLSIQFPQIFWRFHQPLVNNPGIFMKLFYPKN